MGHEQAWRHAYGWRAMSRRFLGSRIQVPVWLVANLGYRFYSRHLADFYNCDWILGQQSVHSDRDSGAPKRPENKPSAPAAPTRPDSGSMAARKR